MIFTFLWCHETMWGDLPKFSPTVESAQFELKSLGLQHVRFDFRLFYWNIDILLFFLGRGMGECRIWIDWLGERHQSRHVQAVGQVHWHDPNLQRAWELCGSIVLALRAFKSRLSWSKRSSITSSLSHSKAPYCAVRPVPQILLASAPRLKSSRATPHQGRCKRTSEAFGHKYVPEDLGWYTHISTPAWTKNGHT